MSKPIRVHLIAGQLLSAQAMAARLMVTEEHLRHAMVSRDFIPPLIAPPPGATGPGSSLYWSILDLRRLTRACRLFTVEETAELIGRNKHTIYNWVHEQAQPFTKNHPKRQGIARPIRIGDSLRFTREEIEFLKTVAGREGRDLTWIIEARDRTDQKIAEARAKDLLSTLERFVGGDVVKAETMAHALAGVELRVPLEIEVDRLMADEPVRFQRNRLAARLLIELHTPDDAMFARDGWRQGEGEARRMCQTMAGHYIGGVDSVTTTKIINQRTAVRAIRAGAVTAREGRDRVADLFGLTAKEVTTIRRRNSASRLSGHGTSNPRGAEGPP